MPLQSGVVCTTAGTAQVLYQAGAGRGESCRAAPGVGTRPTQDAGLAW